MNHIAIFEVAKFDVKGETTDEERNQESRPEEKGCSEEKEVVGRALNKGPTNRFHFEAPVFRGLFLFARPPRNKEGRPGGAPHSAPVQWGGPPGLPSWCCGPDMSGPYVCAKRPARLRCSSERNVSPIPNSSVLSCMRRRSCSPGPADSSAGANGPGPPASSRFWPSVWKRSVPTPRAAAHSWSAVKLTCALISRSPGSCSTSSRAVWRRYPISVPAGNRMDSARV